MFGDQEDDVLIYGGIIPTDNMKQFLRLPAKLKLFNKVVRTKEEVKAEVEATKARWDERDRDERSQDEPISNDKLRIEKDKEYKERKVGFGGVIDLSKITPTDIPTSKEIITPGPAVIEKELKIQN